MSDSKSKGVKKVKQDWCFATLADAQAFMANPPDARFKAWIVTDPKRPGETLYVCERSPLGAVGRAADRWGVKVERVPDAPTNARYLADAVKQLSAAERDALLAELGIAPSKRR